MRARIALAFAAAVALTFAPRGARAQQKVVSGWALDRFDASERGSEWFSTDTLDLRGAVRPAFGVIADFAYKPLSVFNADGSEKTAIVNQQLFLHPGASLVLLDRFRLGVDVPVAVLNDGSNAILRNYRLTAPTGAALGDVRGALDIRIIGTSTDPFTTAIGAQVYVPTGSAAQFTSDATVRVVPRLQFAGEIGPFLYAARGGVSLRGSDNPVVGQTRGTGLVYGVSAGLRVLDRNLVVGPELAGAMSISNSDATQQSLEALLGVHYTIARDFRIGVGGGPGIINGWGEPLVRVVGALEFAPHYNAPPPPKPPDQDSDGINDDVDACPYEPGPTSSDPKKNGCPLPKDQDKDGILDEKDACPELAGSANDDPKKNGCPPDSDGDGVYDPIDACPSVAGVQQSDPSQNGCPPDSDRDGVIDEEDACPDVAGIKSSDPQLNGCPDPDRDHDGVKNDVDACPDEAGTASPDPKKNGCPKAFVQAGQIRITDQVKFKTASAQITGKDSDEVLTAVAKVFGAHPEIAHVTVEGHTDNRGNAQTNLKLSEQRAASVVKWLVSHGIDASKLNSVGYGQERPLDSNATEDGRKNNRRVEFHIEDAAKKE